MRPTNLNFRSPKERTGEYYDPQLAHDGKRIKFSFTEPTRSTFSKQKRFLQYKIEGERTSAILGPGSHNPLNSILYLRKKPCTVTYVTPYTILEAYFPCQNWISRIHHDQLPNCIHSSTHLQVRSTSKTEVRSTAVFSGA